MHLVEGFRVYAETHGISSDSTNYRDAYWSFVKQKQSDVSTNDSDFTFSSWNSFDSTKSLVHTLKAPTPPPLRYPPDRFPWHCT